jgi:hypothetical protein
MAARHTHQAASIISPYVNGDDFPYFFTLEPFTGR